MSKNISEHFRNEDKLEDLNNKQRILRASQKKLNFKKLFQIQRQKNIYNDIQNYIQEEKRIIPESQIQIKTKRVNQQQKKQVQFEKSLEFQNVFRSLSQYNTNLQQQYVNQQKREKSYNDMLISLSKIKLQQNQEKNKTEIIKRDRAKDLDYIHLIQQNFDLNVSNSDSAKSQVESFVSQDNQSECIQDNQQEFQKMSDKLFKIQHFEQLRKRNLSIQNRLKNQIVPQQPQKKVNKKKQSFNDDRASQQKTYNQDLYNNRQSTKSYQEQKEVVQQDQNIDNIKQIENCQQIDDFNNIENNQIIQCSQLSQQIQQNDQKNKNKTIDIKSQQNFNQQENKNKDLSQTCLNFNKITAGEQLKRLMEERTVDQFQKYKEKNEKFNQQRLIIRVLQKFENQKGYSIEQKVKPIIKIMNEDIIKSKKSKRSSSLCTQKNQPINQEFNTFMKNCKVKQINHRKIINQNQKIFKKFNFKDQSFYENKMIRQLMN